MTTDVRPVPPRCTDDAGSVLVEAAIVFPLLAVLISGLMEFGVAWRNRNIIESSLRNAVRVEAQLGKDKDADKRALISMWSGMSKYKNSSINKVVVYRSTAANGLAPTNCTGATTNDTSGNGVVGLCNVYSENQVKNAGLTSTGFQGSCSAGWDRFWCPANRKNLLTDPPDYVGIWVSVKYTTLTKLFPATNNLTITDWVVARIEPVAA